MRHQIPLWLKTSYLLWMVVWVAVYWSYHGPANFLWLCDVTNFFVAAALITESPLLFSSQATGVLVIQLVWMIDFSGRLIIGHHLIGGTEYMFDVSQPIGLRAMSLFHLFVPILLLWAIWRLGYDRRGWKLEAGIVWLILPLSFVAASPDKNLNWLWSPFGIEQTLVSPADYLLFSMFAYPIVLFWPTHRALLRWTRRRGIRILPDRDSQKSLGTETDRRGKRP